MLHSASCRVLVLLLAAVGTCGSRATLPQWQARYNKGLEFARDGFEPIDCFAGQVKVKGKRLREAPFTVFAARDKKCCGLLVKTGRTDKHGHFVVEPLTEGRYFVTFDGKDSEHTAAFGVLQSYERCSEGEYLAVNFSDPKAEIILPYIVINDSGEPCAETAPECFRK